VARSSTTLFLSVPLWFVAASSGLPEERIVEPSPGLGRWTTAFEAPSDAHPDRTLAAIDRLNEVHWTVEKPSPLGSLASRWGIEVEDLVRLNPALEDVDEVDEGQSLLVYRSDPAKPNLSLGAPNRGRLKRGIPMPEGSHWTFKARRAKTYGTKYAVEGLVSALEAYATKYPDGPKIRLGDLSGRNGGHNPPHVSHRTGRDVDIGFILDESKRGSPYWERARASTFDVEKNWEFIRALVDTERVQSIFIAQPLQRLLLKHARTLLGPEELARYFASENHDPRSPAIIRHIDGHTNHMHVRFDCDPEHRRCVRNSYASKG